MKRCDVDEIPKLSAARRIQFNNRLQRPALRAAAEPPSRYLP
jgi:hypothetical protein